MMQIVIEIPEENYQVTLTKIMLACRGCGIIELPKWHGRLIDADAIIKVLREMNIIDKKDKQSVRFATFVLENAPTIIEADNVESEEEPYKEVEE